MTTLGEKFACEIGGSPVDQQVCTRTDADGWGREAAAAALAMAAEWTGGAA
jgi:methanogenic corrinoid protein MtbC1